MKRFSWIWILLAFAPAAWAQDAAPAAPSVDEIVNRANLAAYYQGQDGKSHVEMKITDSQGRTRQRVFNILRYNIKKGGDQDYFVYFLEPADVRRMVYMVQKHVGLNKDDDRWLYIPSLDLVKRIAASDKRTSFVGSDFLYEDVSGRSPELDTHELVKTTADRYVLKNVPKEPDKVEFKYYLVEIDKKTYMPMKMEYYDHNDKLYRVIESTKLEMIPAKEDGKDVEYPTVTESVAKDLNSGSQTEMKFTDVKYNIGLSKNLFTERYLRRPPREAMR